MNCKRIVFMVLILFSSSLFAEEKWNILISDWKDLSPKKDKTTGLIIKRSIASQLKKNNNFRVWMVTNSDIHPENTKNVQLQGVTNKADMVLYGEYYYGDYYIQGTQLLVTVELYDVLEKKVKMRKYYTGTISADIFDTIDSMAVELREKVAEVLPPIEAESEVRIKKLRETVYESKKVELKRLFYTKIGALTDFGTKTIHFEGYNNGTNHPASIPLSVMTLGFMLRYWDIRLDFTLSGIPGLPFMDWTRFDTTPQPSTPNYTSFSMVYYLPWWDGQWALGGGWRNMSFIEKVFTNNGRPEYDTFGFNGGMAYSVNLFWNPSPSWELSLSVMPYIYWEITQTGTDDKGNPTKEVQKIYYNIPNTYLSATYFFNSAGVEAGIFFNWGKVLFSGDNMSDNANPMEFTTAAFMLNFVYKVDFMGKEAD